MQSFEKEIDAPSQEIAIHRAITAMPNMQFIQVSATQLDPQTDQQVPQATANTPTGGGRLPGFKPLQPLQGLNPGWPQNQQQAPVATEGRLPVNPQEFAFPYSISLPGRFSRVLHETTPVRVHQHSGQHSIILESEQDMRAFLIRLGTHPDRAAVRAIISGIRSSMG